MLPLWDQLSAILPFCQLSFCGPVGQIRPPWFNSIAGFKVSGVKVERFSFL